MKFMLGSTTAPCSTIAALLTAMAAPLDVAAQDPTKALPPRVYSVINLVSLDGAGMLNGPGHVAMTGNIAGKTAGRFFDGNRLHPMQLPAARTGSMQVYGLNNGGMALIRADDPDTGFPENGRAFSWSLARGGRLVTTSGPGSARAINAGEQIAGYVQSGAQQGRAVRWNRNGSQTLLGTAPDAYAEAMAINDNGLAGGYSDERAIVWDAQGVATDLGAMGGNGAVVNFLNATDQAAGSFNAGGSSGVFLWRRNRGLIKIGPFERLTRLTGLNDHGQIAANRQVGQIGLITTFAPFTWSAGRGLKMLPLAGAAHARVDGINNRAEMVGFIQRTEFDERTRRAVYWNDLADPVDLNTRLYRAPGGLVLTAATGINDDGSILAESNAGLVVLRPGRGGTAAPVLGPLTAPPEADYATLGSTLDFGLNFVDGNWAETHVASASVNDGCPQGAPSLREVRGAGDVSLRQMFCNSGFFVLEITVTDRAGNATQAERQVYVGTASSATTMRR